MASKVLSFTALAPLLVLLAQSARAADIYLTNPPVLGTATAFSGYVTGLDLTAQSYKASMKCSSDCDGAM